MKKCSYAIVILNYNTITDAINAAKSVIRNALDENYMICIVDNASKKTGDHIHLECLQLKNTVTLQCIQNYGYAKGNVEGINYLRKICDFEYLVIMNPDVLINQSGTIERLISVVSNSHKNIVGAQPLINTSIWNTSPEFQINIRRTPTTILDVLIYASSIYRKLFKKHAEYINYVLERPYENQIEYEVPSGAFFMIKNKVFKELGDFDCDTFMYCEEPILGFKMKNKQMKFVLVPDVCVKHYHGKSTGSHDHKISDFSRKCLLNSWNIYMDKYLNEKKWKINLVILGINFEMKLKNLIYR